VTRGTLDTGRLAAGRQVGIALGRCIAMGARDFGDTCWGRQPLLSRAADLPASFDDLLDLDAADELLSRRGVRTPFVRIARNGEVLDSRQFTGPGGVGAEIADQVRDDQVARLFADGCTVVLQALHRTHPPVIDFVARLSAELGHPCQANAYLTPAAARGFGAHYDVHDVFVLQLSGRKHWMVHRPVHESPLRSQPWDRHRAAVAERAKTEPPVIDAVLEPGDAMYLPRGWLHSGIAQAEVSAHLTVGIHVLTRFALVEAVLAQLAETLAGEPELRHSLPLGIDAADPDQLAPHLDTVRAAVAEAAANSPAGAVSRRIRERVWSGGRPEPVPPLAHAQFLADLRASDTVRLRAGLGHRLRTTPDQLVLELGDRTITFPPGVAAPLAQLLSGRPVVVGGLPELDEPSRLVLVRRLVREGVLVPAAAAGGTIPPQ
jgi:hypothetical protein